MPTDKVTTEDFTCRTCSVHDGDSKCKAMFSHASKEWDTPPAWCPRTQSGKEHLKEYANPQMVYEKVEKYLREANDGK